MSGSPQSPVLYSTPTHSPSLDPVTRYNEQQLGSGSRSADTPPPLLVSTTPPCRAVAGYDGSPSNTTSPPPSPTEDEPPDARHRASTRPPEPVHALAADDVLTAPSTSTEATLPLPQRIADLAERLHALLMPSTERLLRLRAALKGLMDATGSPSPSSSTPGASPPISPSQPHDLSIASSPRLSNASEAVPGPPRLCVTGVSDVEMDEVFQFLLHRDHAAGRGGSAGVPTRAGVNSASSVARPPTPDINWLTPSHLSPMASASTRRARAEAAVAAANPVSGVDGVLASRDAPPHAAPVLLPGVTAAMAVSVSGLLSSSSATLVDEVEASMTAPTSEFPATPPPPPPSTLSKFVRNGSNYRASPFLTDSPSPEHFTLPTLHSRSESGILKRPGVVAADGKDAEGGREAKAGVLLPLAPPAASSAGAAGGGRRVPAAPPGTTVAATTNTTSATVITHPRSLSPHPPLLLNGTHLESLPGGGAGSLITPKPPLPAAPANHHLKAARPAVSPEPRPLAPAPGSPSLPRDAEAANADMSATSPFAKDRDAAPEHSAELSATLPDIGSTPPPAAPTALRPFNSDERESTPPPPPPPPTAVTTMVDAGTPLSPALVTEQLSNQLSSPALSHPALPGMDGSGSPLAPYPCSSQGGRRRTTAHPSVPSPPLLASPEPPATPAPIVTVLLHRTASQYSVSSEHQRSLVANSPSPTTAGRFNALPTPFFSRVSGVSGAASSTGRSLHDDSTVLSPGSSFSPAAARFVQRLRRRTVALAPAQLRLSAYDLFHRDRLSDADVALLRPTRASLTAATAAADRGSRASKGAAPTKGGGSAGPPLLHRRSPQPSSLNASPTTASSTALHAATTPWMVGISEEGVLRCEPLASAQASPPYMQSPPITTTSDYCLVCLPYDAVCPPHTRGVSGDETESPPPHPAATSASGVDEAMSALNLFFGVFAPPRQYGRAAAPATSILITPESAAGRGGADGPLVSLSSPPLSMLASPNRDAGGTFGFPALGPAGSNSEVGLRSSMRSWRKTPSFHHDRPGAGELRGGAFDSRTARATRSESPPHRLSSAGAHTAATFLQAVTDRLGGDAYATANEDSQLSTLRRPSHEVTLEGWLCPLRQALVQRAVFVLVKSEVPPTSPLSSACRRRGAGADAAGGAQSPSKRTSPSDEAAMRNFVHLLQSRYGVTVPSWRVVVFSYHESVVTRNFLLSYYAHLHPSAELEQQQPQQSSQRQRRQTEIRYARQETAEGAFLEDAAPPAWRDRAASRYSNDNVSAASAVDDPSEHAAADSKPLVVLQPSSPPLLPNGSATHAPPRSVVSPLVKPLQTSPSGSAHASSSSANSSGSASSHPQRGTRPESWSNFIKSTSRLHLANTSLRDSAAPPPPPEPLPEPSAEMAAESRGSDAEGDGAAAQDSKEAAAERLFALLTKDVVVPPLSTCVAAYAPLMAMHGGAAEAAVSPPPPPPPAAVPAASSSDGPFPLTAVRSGVSGRMLSISTVSNSHRGSGSVAVEAGEREGPAAAACTHALQVMWQASGAAPLNEALRFFEHDAVHHRSAHGAFQLMAWTWQLGELLPAIVRETQLRCSRLRHSRRHAAHRLEALEKSIEMHLAASPATNVSAMEARLQGDVEEMTQRFLKDVRRVLVAHPPPPLPPSPTASASGGSATAASSSASRSSAHAAAPALDALRVYETPALRDAFRRFVHAVDQFRDFYMGGHVVFVEAGDSAKKKPIDILDGIDEAPPKTSDEAGSGTSREDAAGARHNVSLYEHKYSVLRDALEQPADDLTHSPCTPPFAGQQSQQHPRRPEQEDGIVSVVAVAPKKEEESGSPFADASTSTRAASMSALAAPPHSPPHGAHSRGSQSAPPPPRLPDKDGVEEVRMPGVDRSTPRERHISLIASVASSSASASLLGSSFSTSRSRPSLTEAATATREAKTAAPAMPAPRRRPRTRLSRAQLQHRRASMEHQLIAHVSQINTELINFFLATCVAALPRLQRSCVQAELDRVKTAHANMYSAFTTTVRGRKEAAVAMAQMYGNLEQWASEVGPLLSMVRSRHYLEKFISQLRAVLCEDQIRGLAAYRQRHDIPCDGEQAPLTGVNLARHCTAIASTVDRPSGASGNGVGAVGPASATGAAQAEVGVRSARLLLYYTRLACKPDPVGKGSPARLHGADNASFTPSSTRPGRPTSAASTATSHASSPRRRNAPHQRTSSLCDTVSLTSMSAAWRREEDAVRSPGRVAAPPRRSSRPLTPRSDDVVGAFRAAPKPPCMSAVAAALLAALGAEATTAAAAASSPPASLPSSATSPSRQRNLCHDHTLVEFAEEEDASRDAKPGAAVAKPIRTAEATDGLAAWGLRLRAWRARMSAAERPPDIAEAPLLWLLLDAWDETLLRFPYGLLVHLDTARYADSLNGLALPVLESQLSYKGRLTETVKSAAKQLTTLEADLRRLQNSDGEVSADYLGALRAIFDEAALMAVPHDEAEHARYFS